MAKQVLETQHAQVFLDVVFGVIISLPMAELPRLAHDWLMAPSKRLLIPVLLLISAIIFCAFYWLEVRRFIEEQRIFNETVEKLDRSLDLINFTVIRLVGSLGAIILVAAVLKFAELNFFRSFLAANALFWGLDFLGNIEGNRIYQDHKKSYEQVRKTCPPELQSYVRRFGTFVFWWDGGISVIIFLVLLVIDHSIRASELFRVAAATGVLFLTLFRHVFWRTVIYDRWKGIRKGKHYS